MEIKSNSIENMSELSKIVRTEIIANGRITFEKFMELALYHEEYGYYSSGKVSIGTEGDFYTSPYASKVFGEVLADFIAKSLELINAAKPKIVEIGGGKGTLAKDILDATLKKYPEIYNKLMYQYIEHSPNLRKKAKGLLNNHSDKTEFIDAITDIEDESINGVILSNELFDAIPFHRMIINKSILKEFYVSIQDNELVEETDLPSTDEIDSYISEYSFDLIEGQEFEINLGAKKMISEISRILNKGIVLTIDYGYLAQELYSSSRMKGTYKCMKGHTINEKPYTDIGEQDITAHVNFSDLIKRGKEFGLKELKYTTQGQFLVDFGILDIIDSMSKEDEEESGKKISSIKNLFLPGSMGNKFKVLIQEKNLDKKIEDFYPEPPFKISFDVV